MRNPSLLSRTGTLLLLMLSLAAIYPGQLSAATPAYQWSTVVGRASAGSEDGTGDKARFNAPYGIALDAVGNRYVADKNNHTVRRIAPGGIVTTLAGSPGQAGSADGAGSAARFKSPEGVAVDALGNVYVADTGNHTIRKISSTGTVTTISGVAGAAGFADGPVGTALFKIPAQIGVDGAGIVYVLDNAGIRRIMNGQVETIYQGGGTITVANYNNTTADAVVGPISGLAVANDGQVYFTVGLQIFYSSVGASSTFPALLKRSAVGAVTFVQGGPLVFGGGSVFYHQLAVDAAGNAAILGYSDWEGMQYPIFLVRPDGTFTQQSFLHRTNGLDIEAHGIALSATGDVYVSRDDNTIFRQPATGSASLLAGVSRDTLPFESAWSVAVDGAGTTWVAREHYRMDFGNRADSVSLQKVAPDGTLTMVIAPKFTADLYGSSLPLVAVDGTRGVYFLNGVFTQNTLTRVAADGTITDAPIGLKQPNPGPFVGFYAVGFVVDPNGNPVVPDSYGHALWRRAADGTWAILAGKDGEAGNADGTGGDARFNDFQSIAIDRSGNFYVLDSKSDNGNPQTSVIRRITAAGVVTTVSGNLVQPSPQPGAAASQPMGLTVDSKGVFYLTYPWQNSIWRLEPGGTPARIGGVAGSTGDADGIGDAARFFAPGGIAVDAQDRLLVLDAEAGNLRRAIPLLGPTISAQPQSVSVAPGGTAQFSVTASGTPAPTYQWNFNGTPISGATASSYSLGSAQTANAGNYTVTVSNSQGSTTSSTAMLTVMAGGGGNGSGSGSGGGGGAPGLWFYAALGAIVLIRFGVSSFARHTGS